MKFIAVIGYKVGVVDYIGPFDKLTDAIVCIQYLQAVPPQDDAHIIDRWHVARLTPPVSP